MNCFDMNADDLSMKLCTNFKFPLKLLSLGIHSISTSNI